MEKRLMRIPNLQLHKSQRLYQRSITMGKKSMRILALHHHHQRQQQQSVLTMSRRPSKIVLWVLEQHGGLSGSQDSNRLQIAESQMQ